MGTERDRNERGELITVDLLASTSKLAPRGGGVGNLGMLEDEKRLGDSRLGESAIDGDSGLDLVGDRAIDGDSIRDRLGESMIDGDNGCDLLGESAESTALTAEYIGG